jgi:PAS domain S-box-containing protein
MHGQDGAVAFVAGSSRDITERERMEKELRASEEKYRNLFENMAEEVHFWQIVRDEAGEIQTWRLVDANPPTLKTWGRASIDEIRGKTTDEIFGPGATEHYMPVVRKIMREGTPHSFEDYFPNLDKYFRFTSVPIGEYFITTGADITSARQAELAMGLANEQLQQQAEELEVQTEELQAQTEELVEANHKLIYQASLLDNISEAAISTDANLKILGWNRAAETMYGWRAEEAMGEVTEVLLMTDYLDGASTAGVLRQLEEKSCWKGEVCQKRKDGSRIYAAASMTHLTDSAGRTTGIIAINRDITERKAAEEALRQSREDLDRAQAVGQIGWWRLDTRKNVLTWSPENHRIFGVPEGTSMSYEFFLSTVHPDDRQYVDTQWQAGLRGEPYDIEHRIVAGGKVKWVREKAYLEFDGEGKLLGGFGITQDITARRLAEEALHDAHEHAAWLARFPDENPNPVVRVAVDGRVLYRNQAAIKTPGLLCEEDLKLPHAIQVVTKQAMDLGEEIEADLDLCGRVYTLSVMPFRSDGYLNVYARDVTARKAAEAALAETAKKLEQSNQELEQFAFMASHDLQEPLRKLRVFGSSLQQKIQGELDEDTRESLQRMLNASERMQAMIDDLLQLSRVNMQGRPFIPVDLSAAAAEVVSDLELRILSSGGQVVVEALPCIEADPTQIHQALQNLIANGLKFHKPDTPPVVKVSAAVARSGTGKGELVSIHVEDNGVGFEQQQLERILQPFQRLHSRSEYEGTGIGLAIVKKIIDRHHGVISAQSTPGVGSTFTITLPVIQGK